jgi:hypothetical protein
VRSELRRPSSTASGVRKRKVQVDLWPDANDRTRRAAGELLDQSLGAAADPLRTESQI